MPDALPQNSRHRRPPSAATHYYLSFQKYNSELETSIHRTLIFCAVQALSFNFLHLMTPCRAGLYPAEDTAGMYFSSLAKS
jgi:hypothetical protein